MFSNPFFQKKTIEFRWWGGGLRPNIRERKVSKRYIFNLNTRNGMLSFWIGSLTHLYECLMLFNLVRPRGSNTGVHPRPRDTKRDTNWEDTIIYHLCGNQLWYPLNLCLSVPVSTRIWPSEPHEVNVLI